MSRSNLLVILLAVTAALAGVFAARQFLPAAPPASALPKLRAVTVFPSPRAVPDFVLQGGNGAPVDKAALAGHWTVVFLGFTHCPDICPTTLAQLATAQKQWQAIPRATRPRVLFVSADPERDTPALLARYAAAFHPDTLTATAPLPQLEAFVRSLSLVFMKVPGPSGDPADYSIDHSAALVLLDPQGRMAGVVQPPFQMPDIAADLADLVAGSGGSGPHRDTQP